MKITRELVERYAMAIGAGKLPSQVMLSSAITWLWNVMPEGDLGRNEIAFRLGLCAAAEKLIATADSCNVPGTKGDDAERLARMVQVATLRSEASDLLSEAGVGWSAWEKARAKGGG